MLDKHAYMPLYIQLKEELEGRIKSGQWDVDGRIPSENELMREFGVGRATVREAVSRLVNEGYLVKRRGIGTFVALRQPSLVFEPLISLTYSLRALGVNPVNVIEEKKTITPGAAILADLRWKKSRRCFYIKRLRFADKIPIAIEESYFDESFRDLTAGSDLTQSFARIMLEELGLSVKRVEQVVIPRAATKQEQEKYRLEGEHQVLELKRWIYVEGGDEPYYYLRFIITGDIYNLSML
jgi:DNA-binding GntR family transcriptional regulator